MKVWHDDNRYPPSDEWEWAKTNAEAIALLETGEVTFISLDMDLGARPGIDFNYGRETGGEYRGEKHRSVDWLRNMNDDPGENGVDLVKWMVENKQIPARVVVHTWNGWGADAMIGCFTKAGHTHIERIFWSGDTGHLERVYG